MNSGDDPAGCILLALTPLLGAWVALFLRARCRDRLLEQAAPIMERSEQRSQWLHRSPLTDWLVRPFRQIRLLKSAPLPPELHKQLQRFARLTHIAIALVVLVVVVAAFAHFICEPASEPVMRGEISLQFERMSQAGLANRIPAVLDAIEARMRAGSILA